MRFFDRVCSSQVSLTLCFSIFTTESSPSRLSTPNQPKLLFSPTPLHGYVVSAAATTSDSGGGNGGSGDSGGSGGSGVGDVRSWSSERVKNWLAETSLSHLSHKFVL